MMKVKFILSITAILLISLTSCISKDPKELIQKSIEYYGMDAFQESEIMFNFREYNFKVKHHHNIFLYERSYVDSTGKEIHDVLTNENFYREIESVKIPLSKKDSLKYANQVNSVVYFALLPLKLQDPAVKSEYVNEVTVKGKHYHKLKVNFTEDSGGEDHDDIFYYWFDFEDYSMDYLAYGSGGNRFRAVKEIKEDKGIKFQNYLNYEGNKNESSLLINYDSLYQADNLQLLSEIVLENIHVKL